jgi:hypothetical protein
LQPPSAIPAGAGSSSQHAIELNNEPSDALAPAPKLKAPIPPDPHPRAEDDLDDENDEVQYVPGSLATAIEASHVGDVVPRRRWRWTRRWTRRGTVATATAAVKNTMDNREHV